MFINIAGKRINKAMISSYEIGVVETDDKQSKKIIAIVLQIVGQEHVYIKCPDKNSAEDAIQYFDLFMAKGKRSPTPEKDIKVELDNQFFRKTENKRKKK